MDNQKRTLNVVPGISVPTALHASRGDVGRVLEFILVDGTNTFEIPSTATVTVTATKPSGMGFTETCTVTAKGTATISTTAAMTDESGTMLAELRIVDGNDNIGTANFQWIVEKDPHPSNVIDGDVEQARTILQRAEEAMTAAEEAVETAQTYAEEVSDKYSAPLVVTSASDMTDESKTYLLGTNWYYYNGTAWVIGGEYGDGVQIDATLTQSGQAADAKATGDAIGAISEGNETITVDKSIFSKLNAYIGSSTAVIKTDSNCKTVYFPCAPNTVYTISKVQSARYRAGYTTTTPADNVSVYDLQQDNTATSLVVTTGSNAQYVVVYYYDAANDTLSESVIYDSLQATYEGSGEVTAVDRVARSEIIDIQDDVDDLKSHFSGEDTFTGNVVAHVTKASGGDNVKSLEINITALQSGSGVPSSSNVRNISGWTSATITKWRKNMIGTLIADGKVPSISTGALVNAVGVRSDYIPAEPDTAYSFKFSGTFTGTYSTYMFFYDRNKNFISFSGGDSGDEVAETSPSNTAYIMIRLGNATDLSKVIYAQLEIAQSPTEYEAVSKTDYTVSWNSVAGTVYGGTLDVTTGDLTVTHGYIASYSGQTINEPWISNKDEYVAGGTPSTGAQVVYPLTTPSTYHINPVAIPESAGINNYTASNIGGITVTLSTDSIDVKLPNAIKNAILACFEHVAWADDDGQDYYNALYTALNS